MSESNLREMRHEKLAKLADAEEKKVEAEAAAEPRPYEKPIWEGPPPALALEADILGKLAEEAAAAGIAGEDVFVRLVILAVNSRVLPCVVPSERPLSLIVKGTTSTGKSYVIEIMLEFIPETSWIEVTSSSTKGFIYDERSLQHKVVFISEWTTIAEDEELISLLRSLVSRKHVEHITVTGEGTKKGKIIEKDGPIGLLMTTTRAHTDEELESRCLIPAADDTPDQTRRVVQKAARVHLGEYTPPNQTSWHEYGRWLEAQDNRVIVPYAKEIADLIPVGATRIRRDFNQLLCMIQTHAAMHQASRLPNKEGRGIEATRDDYEAARKIVDALLAEGADAHVRPSVREAAEHVRRLHEKNGRAISARELTESLGIGKAATYARIRAGLSTGYIVNEAAKGYSLVPGATLPNGSAEFLPTWDAIYALGHPDSAEAAEYNSRLSREPATAPPVEPLTDEQTAMVVDGVMAERAGAGGRTAETNGRCPDCGGPPDRVLPELGTCWKCAKAGA